MSESPFKNQKGVRPSSFVDSTGSRVNVGMGYQAFNGRISQLFVRTSKVKIFGGGHIDLAHLPLLFDFTY